MKESAEAGAGEAAMGSEKGRGSANGGERSHGPVITIDGPAGSGKSTTAREVARRLGFRHLDSGALYRALTYAILETGLPSARWDALTDERLDAIPIRLDAAPEGFAILLDDRPLDGELRTPRVTENVSRLAPLPAVRNRLLSLQREAASLGGLVADGRDMGSVVFPDADVKVFLVADLEERARRRLLEQRESDRSGAPTAAVPPAAEEVREESARLHERDTRDSVRALAPLRRPADALLLDTTDLGFEEQVEAIIERVQEVMGHAD